MAAEDWQIVAVAEALRRSTDVGESMTRAQLQEECGIGAGDLEAALDVVRERGGAWEVEPGVYSAGPEPAAGDDDVVVERAAPAVTPDVPRTAADLPGRPRQPAPAAADPVRVEMPMGVAGGMDAAALGSIVKAGIEQAQQETRAFVFEARS